MKHRVIAITLVAVFFAGIPSYSIAQDTPPHKTHEIQLEELNKTREYTVQGVQVSVYLDPSGKELHYVEGIWREAEEEISHEFVGAPSGEDPQWVVYLPLVTRDYIPPAIDIVEIQKHSFCDGGVWSTLDYHVQGNLERTTYVHEVLVCDGIDQDPRHPTGYLGDGWGWFRWEDGEWHECTLTVSAINGDWEVEKTFSVPEAAWYSTWPKHSSSDHGFIVPNGSSTYTAYIRGAGGERVWGYTSQVKIYLDGEYRSLSSYRSGEVAIPITIDNTDSIYVAIWFEGEVKVSHTHYARTADFELPEPVPPW